MVGFFFSWSCHLPFFSRILLGEPARMMGLSPALCRAALKLQSSHQVHSSKLFAKVPQGIICVCCGQFRNSGHRNWKERCSDTHVRECPLLWGTSDVQISVHVIPHSFPDLAGWRQCWHRQRVCGVSPASGSSAHPGTRASSMQCLTT